jgi:hypothetical protein
MKYIIIALAMVMPFAFAEEAIVDVPFDYNSHGCFLEADDLYICKFRVITAEDLPKDPRIDVTGNVTTTSDPEEDEEEEKSQLEVFIDVNQKYIDNLKEKQARGQTDNVEEQTLEAFENLRLCARGVMESSPIQTYDTFIVSPHELPDLKSLDLKKTSKLVKLIKKGLECKYQWEILHPKILGPQYLHLGIEDSRPEIRHHSEIAEDETVYPSQVRGSLESEAIKAQHTAICNSNLDALFKVQSGCNNVYDYPEWEGKQDPKQNDPYEYYTPMIKMKTWEALNGNPDLKEYREKNQDNVNVHTLANSLGVDPVALEKFLEGQK